MKHSLLKQDHSIHLLTNSLHFQIIFAIYIYMNMQIICYIYKCESHLHAINQSFNNAFFCVQILYSRQNECGSTGELLLLSSWLYRSTPYHSWYIQVYSDCGTIPWFTKIHKYRFLAYAFLIEEATCFPPLVALVTRSSVTRDTANKFRRISIKTMTPYTATYIQRSKPFL